MSVREAVAAATTVVEEAAEAPVVEQPIVQAEAPAPVVEQAAPEGETAEQKAGRTAGRARDEQGRLLPGKAQKEAAAPESKPTAGAAVAPPLTPVAAAPAELIGLPKSIKLTHREAWEKLAAENPALAKALAEREPQFEKGISTYKQEYERVASLAQAIQPFLPQLQQHGIDPARWITNLGQAHHQLALGSPQEKLQRFQQLAQDYGVPLQALYDPAAQQQFLQQPFQRQQAPAQQPDFEQLIEQKLVQREVARDVASFGTLKDASGQPLYPHYETVRQTMAQLLDAGIAQDLPDAYRRAIRLDDELFSAEQAAQNAAATQARLAAQAKATAAAKANAISPRTATPSAGNGAAASSAKSVRDSVREAADAIEAGGGRV